MHKDIFKNEWKNCANNITMKFYNRCEIYLLKGEI